MRTVYAKTNIRTRDKDFAAGEVVEGLDDATLKELAQSGALTYQAPEGDVEADVSAEETDDKPVEELVEENDDEQDGDESQEDEGEQDEDGQELPPPPTPDAK